MIHRPSKAGSAVLFSGKNLHEGVPVTSGVRYILTGFCEYAYDCSDTTPHEAFMKDYKKLHDGYAAQGGIRTGDVIKGIFDSNEEIHYVNKENKLRDLLESHSDDFSGKDWTLLVERLHIPEDIDEIGADECHQSCSGRSDGGCDVIMGTSIVEIYQDNTKDATVDEEVIRDIIHHSDLFLTVGQFWKFDDK